jgi:hypothetical protein
MLSRFTCKNTSFLKKLMYRARILGRNPKVLRVFLLVFTVTSTTLP